MTCPSLSPSHRPPVNTPCEARGKHATHYHTVAGERREWGGKPGPKGPRGRPVRTKQVKAVVTDAESAAFVAIVPDGVSTSHVVGRILAGVVEMTAAKRKRYWRAIGVLTDGRK